MLETSEALEKTVDKLTLYVAKITVLVFSSPVTHPEVEAPSEGTIWPARPQFRQPGKQPAFN
jgi:hypothetical protein